MSKGARAFCSVAENSPAKNTGGGVGGERKRRARGYWNERENRRAFLLQYAEEKALQWDSGSAWESVTVRDLKAAGGSGLVAFYGGSLRTALADLIPELKGSGAKEKMKKGHWSVKENRRRFLETFAASRGASVTEPAFWVTVTSEELIKEGGAGVLSKYQRSVYDMLVGEIEEVQWEARTCRPQTPVGYWHKWENRRAFMERVAKEMGVKEVSDWKNVSYREVVAMGGTALAREFPTILSLVADAFPEYSEGVSVHKVTKRLPKSHWKEERLKENVRSFLDHVKDELSLVNDGDWTRVSHEQLGTLGGYALLNRGFKLVDLLRIAYPTVTWDPVQFESGSSMRAAQRNLLQQVRGIFITTAPAAAAAPVTQ